jgi:hypothetical protein
MARHFPEQLVAWRKASQGQQLRAGQEPLVHLMGHTVDQDVDGQPGLGGLVCSGHRVLPKSVALSPVFAAA